MFLNVSPYCLYNGEPPLPFPQSPVIVATEAEKRVRNRFLEAIASRCPDRSGTSTRGTCFISRPVHSIYYTRFSTERQPNKTYTNSRPTYWRFKGDGTSTLL